METIQWAKNVLEIPECQEALERSIEDLLNSSLKEKNEYQQEKAIKSFYEGIKYLESLLMYKNGIHHEQIKDKLPFLDKKDYVEKREEIKQIILTEIKRQARHFSIFL